MFVADEYFVTHVKVIQVSLENFIQLMRWLRRLLQYIAHEISYDATITFTSLKPVSCKCRVFKLCISFQTWFQERFTLYWPVFGVQQPLCVPNCHWGQTTWETCVRQDWSAGPPTKGQLVTGWVCNTHIIGTLELSVPFPHTRKVLFVAIGRLGNCF